MRLIFSPWTFSPCFDFDFQDKPLRLLFSKFAKEIDEPAHCLTFKLSEKYLLNADTCLSQNINLTSIIEAESKNGKFCLDVTKSLKVTYWYNLSKIIEKVIVIHFRSYGKRKTNRIENPEIFNQLSEQLYFYKNKSIRSGIL